MNYSSSSSQEQVNSFPTESSNNRTTFVISLSFIFDRFCYDFKNGTCA